MLWLYLAALAATAFALALYAGRRRTGRESRKTGRLAVRPAPERGSLRDRPPAKRALSKEVELDWEASEMIELQPGAWARRGDLRGGLLGQPSSRGPATATGPRPLDEDYVLPSRYGRDRLVLMARDPRWIYAYWEMAHEKYRDMFKDRLPEWSLSRPVLRLYDLSEGVQGVKAMDVALSDDADNWYVRVDRPHHRFVAEIGRAISGKFVPFLRSNEVSLPPESVSGTVSEEWAPLDWEAHYSRFAGRRATSSPLDWRK